MSSRFCHNTISKGRSRICVPMAHGRRSHTVEALFGASRCISNSHEEAPRSRGLLPDEKLLNDFSVAGYYCEFLLLK